MRVVNVISDTNVGGAGKCLINYANNCFDKNIDLYVIVPKGSLLIPFFNENIKIIEIDGLYDKSMDIWALFKLIKIFKKIKPDIVHTHAVIMARLVARLFFKCKIIYTKHCYYDLKKYEHNFLRRCMYYLFDKFFADKIIIVTKALFNNMKEKGSVVDKIVTVSNGVPLIDKVNNTEKKKIRKKYCIKNTDFVVSIIARLDEDKDHETFIKIADMFKKNGIEDIKYLIVGTGELYDKLNMMVNNLGLDDMVKFTGFVNNISEILSITSLQVNCSVGTEGASLSILEGFSAGVPAIVSNYGGNSYIVKNNVNGYIVDKRDVLGFYKKIDLIKNDNNLYKQLSNNAKKEYLSKYTIDRYVNEINKCYYDVISR